MVLRRRLPLEGKKEEEGSYGFSRTPCGPWNRGTAGGFRCRPGRDVRTACVVLSSCPHAQGKEGAPPPRFRRRSSALSRGSKGKARHWALVLVAIASVSLAVNSRECAPVGVAMGFGGGNQQSPGMCVTLRGGGGGQGGRYQTCFAAQPTLRCVSTGERCNKARGCSTTSVVSRPVVARKGENAESSAVRGSPLFASGLIDESGRGSRLGRFFRRLLRLRGVEGKSGVVSPGAAPSALYERPRVPPRTQKQKQNSPYPALLDDQEADLGRGEWREKPPWLSGVLTWALIRFIHARARHVDDLEVYVAAESNRSALSGNLQTVAVRFKALALPQLQISGGANIQVTGVDLKVLLLLWRRFRAFKRPFEVSGYYVFTTADVGASPLIRNVIGSILNASARKLAALTDGPTASNVVVRRLRIRDGRLEVEGQAVYDALRLRVPFTVKTGVGVGKKGHTVFFKDTEISWEDTVGAGIVLPLTPLQAFDVDMGDNTRIEHIRIKDNMLYLRARFVLSPIPPLIVANMTKRASIRYDVGEKLSTSFSRLLDNVLTWRSALTLFTNG